MQHPVQETSRSWYYAPHGSSTYALRIISICMLKEQCTKEPVAAFGFGAEKLRMWTRNKVWDRTGHTIPCKYHLNSVLGAVLMAFRGKFETYNVHKSLRGWKNPMDCCKCWFRLGPRTPMLPCLKSMYYNVCLSRIYLYRVTSLNIKKE